MNGCQIRPRSHRSSGVNASARSSSEPICPLSATRIESPTEVMRIHFTPRVKGGKARFPIGMDERGDIEGNLAPQERGRSR